MDPRLQAAIAAVGPQALHDMLSPEDRLRLRYSWRLLARPCIPREQPSWLRKAPGYGVWGGQIPPPGDWTVWLDMMGRAGGKTWVGANWSCEQAELLPNERSAVVGATSADARRTMLKGKAGILRMAKPWFYPRWYHTDQTLTWPNGHVTTLYTADEPGRLRGPEHAVAWADEVCAWSDPEAWDMLQMTMRGGSHPRVLVTTTPIKNRIILELVESTDTALSIGSTRENAANLPKAFTDRLMRKYEGTSLGRQELDGELVDELEGALWTRALLEAWRVEKAPELQRIVVAVDPSGSSKARSALCGIAVVGIGEDGEGYVLADLSGIMSPDAWARRAARAYEAFKADRIVYESNHGGEMVAQVFRTLDDSLPLQAVSATRGKFARAEPVVALYEQGRVRHVRDCGVDLREFKRGDDDVSLVALEDQMCTWTPDGASRSTGVRYSSPDRMDALVWGLTELMISNEGSFHLF